MKQIIKSWYLLFFLFTVSCQPKEPNIEDLIGHYQLNKDANSTTCYLNIDSSKIHFFSNTEDRKYTFDVNEVNHIDELGTTLLFGNQKQHVVGSFTMLIEQVDTTYKLRMDKMDLQLIHKYKPEKDLIGNFYLFKKVMIKDLH